MSDRKLKALCGRCMQEIEGDFTCGCYKRTNEPTRSPQEPVVQQSATFDSEQTGVVVQGELDEPDRKDLSVQQSAISLEQIEAVLETVYDGIEAERKSTRDAYDNSIALRGMLAVLECREALRDWFKQQSQVEHEAKRAADC